jgi:DNA-binding response OmpR family regulator
MKILIIEDEEELAKDIANYLSGENYLCEVAKTFAEAIDKINSFAYDCVLLDLMLPGGDGLSILEMLKKQLTLVRCLTKIHEISFPRKVFSPTKSCFSS